MSNEISVAEQIENADCFDDQKHFDDKNKRLQVSDYNQKIFELVVENVEDYAVFMVDINGVIVSWNPGVEKLLNYSEAEFIGQRADIIFTPEDRAAKAAENEIDMTRETGRCEDVRWHVRRDGSRFWANGLMMLLTNDAQEICGFVKIMRDDTRRKHAEEEREELLEQERTARAEAEAATRAKDEFLSLVSHELRNPLNSILGWSSILRQDPTPEMVKKVTDIIERQAKQQDSIIEDLLDTAQIVGGKLSLEEKFVDLVKVITTAIDNTRPMAESKSIILNVRFDMQAAQITGDEQRLLQAISNLLQNATKFTPAGGRVNVELQAADEHALIIVKDSGQGIAPELLPYIFERYKQGNSSTRKRGGGLGLGLSLVKHIVEMHNGTVQAESEGVGKGATFAVRLPFNRANEIKGPGR